MTNEQLTDNSTGEDRTGETGASTGESTGETIQVSEGEPNSNYVTILFSVLRSLLVRMSMTHSCKQWV